MTFNKPSNITYTQMAQWIDSIQNLQDADQDKLVQYLYHLVLFKAQQASLFKEYNTYDDFALFCVGKLLIRLQNSQEAPVKSILNYIKNVLHPWNAEYVREFCTGSPDYELADFNIGDFSDYLIDQSSEFDTNAFSLGSLRVTDVIYKHLRKIPRCKNSSEWSNIYASCLLTFCDRLKLATSLYNNRISEEDPLLFNRVIRQLKTKPPILFHLDESFATYVSVLVNELIHAISAELTFTTASKVSVSSCLRNMVSAASNMEDD